MFKMYGAFGDRYYLPSYYPYAHNLFFEIMLTFGKFFGSIIFITLIYSFLKTFIENKEFEGLLVIATGSFSICRLMFSTSFWTEPYFWAFIALLYNCRYKRMMKNLATSEMTDVMYGKYKV